MTEQIRLDGVSKSFTRRGAATPALTPIDLTVRAGEFLALVGPSGCGKSTILNMVAGLMPPSTGQVLYNGAPVAGPNRRVGYMTQKDTLLPWRTTADNIRLALELACRPTSRSAADDRVAAMIALVGLQGFEKHFPAQLSGGMRKRAALARTLIYAPETLLMDEPFGALDAQLKLVMLDQLQRLTQDRAMTVLFVTHDLEEALTLADRIVLFSGRPGRIAAIRDIPFPRPRDVYSIRFTPEFAQRHEALWNEMKADVIGAAG